MEVIVVMAEAEVEGVDAEAAGAEDAAGELVSAIVSPETHECRRPGGSMPCSCIETERDRGSADWEIGARLRTMFDDDTKGE